MTGIEITNLVISIASLLATIAISFVIYFLEKKNTMLREQKEIKDEARRFIIEHADERHYLHWCTIASGCFPQNKHVRKIYNDFTLLPDEVKAEVIKQANLGIDLIRGTDWINPKIESIRNSISKLGLGDDFLYDGAKYFHRLYQYKNEAYDKYSSFYFEHDLYDDVFGYPSLSPKHKGKLYFSRYIDNYLYAKYEDKAKFSKDWVKPFDYLLSVERIRETPDEDYVCFWVGHMISEAMCYAIKYLGYTEKDHVQTDAQIDTFEDRYFEILYELYYLNAPANTKSDE